MPFISDAEYKELQQLKNGAAQAQTAQSQTTRLASVGGPQQQAGPMPATGTQAPSTPRVTNAAQPMQQQAFARNPTQAPVSSMYDPKNKGALAWQSPENQAFVKRVQGENPGAVFHPETGSWTAPMGQAAQANFQRSLTTPTAAPAAAPAPPSQPARQMETAIAQAQPMGTPDAMTTEAQTDRERRKLIGGV